MDLESTSHWIKPGFIPNFEKGRGMHLGYLTFILEKIIKNFF